MTSGVGAAIDFLAHVLCDPDGKILPLFAELFVSIFQSSVAGIASAIPATDELKIILFRKTRRNLNYLINSASITSYFIILGCILFGLKLASIRLYTVTAAQGSTLFATQSA